MAKQNITRVQVFRSKTPLRNTNAIHRGARALRVSSHPNPLEIVPEDHEDSDKDAMSDVLNAWDVSDVSEVPDEPDEDQDDNAREVPATVRQLYYFRHQYAAPPGLKSNTELQK